MGNANIPSSESKDKCLHNPLKSQNTDSGFFVYLLTYIQVYKYYNVNYAV